ncbi:permease [bacterium]|nr:permease [bacterium]
MELKKELKIFLAILGVFLLAFFFPMNLEHYKNPFTEALYLTRWYAREHVILCLVPAFFIAGAISVFLSQNAVMKYLGAEANRVIAYLVASVSGAILAVCSCTILPLFAGIYKRGAGLGPASAFLYSGPAINVLAIILTGTVLGSELAIARGVGAVLFSIVIGILMAFIFQKDEKERKSVSMIGNESSFPIKTGGIYLFLMMIILVIANWSGSYSKGSFGYIIFEYKWWISGGSLVLLLIIILFTLKKGFKDEHIEWNNSTWGYAKQILPLLLMGVLVAGLLLGRPGNEGLIPTEWVTKSVGGNSIFANFFASIVGAFMYFATLTEIPILQGLMANGMGKGPALALLLAGPALSLPNMLVIRSVLGTKKTVVFVSLVIVMAAFSGFVYGSFF